MIQDVYKTTGITATAGIGTNLFLCKVAMDIEAKHIQPNEYGVRIAQLDEASFRKNYGIINLLQTFGVLEKAMLEDWKNTIYILWEILQDVQ